MSIDLRRYPTRHCGLRRQRLEDRLAQLPRAPETIAIPAGAPVSRSYPANLYPYRASSHFLYLVGVPLPGACLFQRGHEVRVQLPPPAEDDALWHGHTPSRSALEEALHCPVAFADEPLTSPFPGDVATVPAPDARTQQRQTSTLGRPVQIPSAEDMALRRVLVELRRCHDEAALDGLGRAAEVTMRAHREGMRATAGVRWAYETRAAMEGEILRAGMCTAYPSIVTPHGEILHADRYDIECHQGDLMLCDVGAETHDGWAGDVTRTLPVSGRYSPAQRTIVELVLTAQRAAISAIRPGVTYDVVHGVAGRALVDGLVDLGVLRGDPATLFADNAHSLFFPHGVGHLLGLDVHDMEDLGDLAGYGDGRARDPRFGWSALRLARPLENDMVVTVEPGFYVVPELVELAAGHPLRLHIGDRLDHSALHRLIDDSAGPVRGVRIEDDVRVTPQGPEVLTGDLETSPDDIEAMMRPS